MNFYCKKLTQVEVGYWLLNVAQYVSCKVVSYFFSCLHGSWKCYGNFHPKKKLILLFY